MFIMMNEARFGVGVQGIGIGERAYQQALAFAKERVQGRDTVTGAVGIPIIKHPDVKRMLLTMRARIMAARALAYTAAGWFDIARHSPDKAAADKAKRYVDLLMPVVKGWSTELCQQVCYDAIQVHGGMGFVEETGIAQHYRDARIITIYEGTTGIQANDLVGAQGAAREWRHATRTDPRNAWRRRRPRRGPGPPVTGRPARRRHCRAGTRAGLDPRQRQGPAWPRFWPAPYPSCTCWVPSAAAGNWPASRSPRRSRPRQRDFGADYLRGLVELARFQAHALGVQALSLSAAITLRR
jgi:hypothetical protein